MSKPPADFDGDERTYQADAIERDECEPPETPCDAPPQSNEEENKL